MTQTPLATWAQLTERPEDGWPGERNPAATVDLDVDMAIRREDDGVLDVVDRQALTAAYVERVREAIRDQLGDGWTLADDGNLHVDEDTSSFHPGPGAVNRVRKIIDEVDPVAMSSMYRRALTSGVIQILVGENWRRELDLPARVYEYGGDEKVRTPAEVVAEAKGKYRAEFDLGDHVSLRHSFTPQANPDAPFAPINPATDTTILSMDATKLIHRTVVSPEGGEYHVDRLELVVRGGTILIWLTPYLDDGSLDDEDSIGVENLAGWAIL